MKECGLCGTELPDNAQFCSTCGNHFDPDFSDRPLIIEAPLWGRVQFTISCCGATDGLLQEVRSVWNSLEKEGQLRLFQEQAKRPLSVRSVLYCPMYSFADLVKAFKGRWSEISFTFTPIASDDLDKVIESFYAVESKTTTTSPRIKAKKDKTARPSENSDAAAGDPPID